MLLRMCYALSGTDVGYAASESRERSILLSPGPPTAFVLQRGEERALGGGASNGRLNGNGNGRLNGNHQAESG
eukprot:3940789-Rhodomonas_salina.4